MEKIDENSKSEIKDHSDIVSEENAELITAEEYDSFYDSSQGVSQRVSQEVR